MDRLHFGWGFLTSLRHSFLGLVWPVGQGYHTVKISCFPEFVALAQEIVCMYDNCYVCTAGKDFARCV